MENENPDIWKTLLTNRTLRTRYIRDLEIQSIDNESFEALCQRYKDEESLKGFSSHQRLASSLT